MFDEVKFASLSLKLVHLNLLKRFVANLNWKFN